MAGFAITMYLFSASHVVASTIIPTTIDTFDAKPPIHILTSSSTLPKGLTPKEVKAAYHLPTWGGSGTIAIISAYHAGSIEKDLSTFTTQFGLAPCTVQNKCLEIHTMSTSTKTNAGWAFESTMDVEWAHAIAPQAKILLIEAKSSKGTDLLKAITYAKSRKDIVAVSMSWGGAEFRSETSLDTYFSSTSITFFASSGDSGTGVSWPAVSKNVVAVGGTTLTLDKTGAFSSEKAWSLSGGGISEYETEPAYQKDYSIAKTNGKRAIPDVSYAANPSHGFSVYHSGKWYVVGGTSAGAPQWAAIQALGKSVSLQALYADKASASSTSYFRDITSGSNGSCAYYCQTRKHYDYVTGLGSPLTVKF